MWLIYVILWGIAGFACIMGLLFLTDGDPFGIKTPIGEYKRGEDETTLFYRHLNETCQVLSYHRFADSTTMVQSSAKSLLQSPSDAQDRRLHQPGGE